MSRNRAQSFIPIVKTTTIHRPAADVPKSFQRFSPPASFAGDDHVRTTGRFLDFAGIKLRAGQHG